MSLALEEVTCFICDDILKNGTVITVGEKGINTSRKASVGRKDDKAERFLKNVKSVII